jgi:hypothetical protein
MDTIELPRFPSDTSLRLSLNAMRAAGRSAVIRDSNDNVDLLKAGDIFGGLAHNIETLGKIMSSNPIFRLSIHEIQEWNLDAINPHQTWDRYEKFLDSKQHSYALLSSTAVSGVVVTRHEGLTTAISSGPKDCYCLGPDQHEFPPPSRSSKDKCDRCGYEVHCEYYY